MKKTSAGILIYKRVEGKLKVFIVHPGGPFWKGKDEKSWDFPKGELDNGEDLLEAGIRELKEETGIDFSNKKREEFLSLGNIVRKDGKTVHIFAIEGDWSGILTGSSYVTVVDGKSGKQIKFLEVDKAGFFSVEDVRKKVFVSLVEFLDRLEEKLKG
ncbi:MAG: NUDIX domain-containing protein [Nanoarchaeota archaeon]|nr:NUDIX domain-containing protein [Nanoarchaeota archaeon]